MSSRGISRKDTILQPLPGFASELSTLRNGLCGEGDVMEDTECEVLSQEEK